jgi:hypothetical protein
MDHHGDGGDDDSLRGQVRRDSSRKRLGLKNKEKRAQARKEERKEDTTL